MTEVIWHDIECGAYDLDLPLWRELASTEGSPVLDVGAGTGRVTLDLARRGHEVVALDRSAALLDALRARAVGLEVTTVAADARDFAVDRRFPLIVVPMQTLQLFGGADGRARFLGRARDHLAPGGLVAVALADALDCFDEEHDQPPPPDFREVAGVVYASRPVAVRDLGGRAAIDRVREIVAADGTLTTEENVVELDRLDPDELEEEAAAFGLRAERARRIPQTLEYVGSTVVMLRG
ncbi:MAG TPA: class I SAM-dependent methyltransferase [Solirubrobacteraceae bacterium]|nr:class I SAM-dependent methyltransferase [Solirubrobacteraceae bacterium]